MGPGAEQPEPVQPGAGSLPAPPAPPAPAAAPPAEPDLSTVGGPGAGSVTADEASGVRWPVLATPNSRRLLATRLTGQAADGLLQAALGSFVLFSPERQATAGQVAAAFALLLLPYSLLGPFTGVFLDRWNRARVLVLANVARGSVMIGIAFMVAADRDGLDLGTAVLISMGIGRLWLAGLSAGLPLVVAPAHLVTANALFPTAGTIASAIATVTGLLLMPVLGPGGATRLILLVATGLLVSAAIASRIPRRALGPEAGEARLASLTSDVMAVVRGMVAGLIHVHHRPRARRGMAVVMAHRVAFGALMVDTLLVVRNTLNPADDPDAALSDFALTAAGASLGSFLAAVTAPRVVRRIGLAPWSATTLFVAAVVAPLSFASLQLPLMAIGSLTMGFAGQTVKIAGDTILQQDIDEGYRGRVFSLYDVGLNVALVSGICLTAFTAPTDGIAPALWIGVGLLLAATGAWSLRPAVVRG
ncbi:MAG TPA: MFS transporter [Candidatus Limnocylindrales bacterium]|nr:MFS transporter [Candidatus Limnocylindrales bacterium]